MRLFPISKSGILVVPKYITSHHERDRGKEKEQRNRHSTLPPNVVSGNKNAEVDCSHCWIIAGDSILRRLKVWEGWRLYVLSRVYIYLAVMFAILQDSRREAKHLNIQAVEVVFGVRHLHPSWVIVEVNMRSQPNSYETHEDTMINILLVLLINGTAMVYIGEDIIYSRYRVCRMIPTLIKVTHLYI